MEDQGDKLQELKCVCGSCAHTHALTHSVTHIRVHSYSHTHTHTHCHLTHTHTHTHTHTQRVYLCRRCAATRVERQAAYVDEWLAVKIKPLREQREQRSRQLTGDLRRSPSAPLKAASACVCVCVRVCVCVCVCE